MNVKTQVFRFVLLEFTLPCIENIILVSFYIKLPKHITEMFQHNKNASLTAFD